MSAAAGGNGRVVLLIDADNVSADVIEQAVERLLAEHGAVHVRRAYGTAESAVKHQGLFKRLGIRPMVNLAAGKNSTDIALAVDAIDLVIAERPQTVVIASSDSDFAPLVARLREKGCRVLGIGQRGKTGDETVAVYDGFTVLEHRKPRARSAAAAAPAPTLQPAPAPVAEPVPAPTPAPRAAARKSPAARRRKADPAPAPAPVVAAAAPEPAPPPLPDEIRSILAAMPELVKGDAVELRVAARRLRDADLLGPKASSTRFFAPYAEHFELVPAQAPNHVRWRAASAA